MKPEHLILGVVVVGVGFFLYQQKKAADARAATPPGPSGFDKLAGAFGTWLGNYNSASEDGSDSDYNGQDYSSYGTDGFRQDYA